MRGTVYRVRNDVPPAAPRSPAGTPAVDTSATEVLEGTVHAQVGTLAPEAADVPANFGAPLESGRKPVVLPLPPAPDLAGVPDGFDQLPIKLHLAGNWPLRVQVANDRALGRVGPRWQRHRARVGRPRRGPRRSGDGARPGVPADRRPRRLRLSRRHVGAAG